MVNVNLRAGGGIQYTARWGFTPMTHLRGLLPAQYPTNELMSGSVNSTHFTIYLNETSTELNPISLSIAPGTKTFSSLGTTQRS